MVSETAKTLSLQQKITLSLFHFRYISLKRIPKKQKKKGTPSLPMLFIGSSRNTVI